MAITNAFTLTWLVDAAERAAKSFAQGVLTAFTGDAVDVWHLDWKAVLGVGLGSAIYSVLSSVISAPVGATATASLIGAVQPKDA